MQPETISAKELAARWCYAELSSSRFACSYSLPASDPLRDKAKSSTRFSSLSDEEVERLRCSLESHPDRGPSFYPLLMGFDFYRREAWEYSQLSDVSLAPGLGWSRFLDFEGAGLIGEPRIKVHETLATIPVGEFIQAEPVIIVPCRYKGQRFHLLLEGTLRSLLFARDRTDATRLQVWMPVAAVPVELNTGPSWL